MVRRKSGQFPDNVTRCIAVYGTRARSFNPSGNRRRVALAELGNRRSRPLFHGRNPARETTRPGRTNLIDTAMGRGRPGSPRGRMGGEPPYFSSTRAVGASPLIRSIPLWQSALFL